jgi:hypothetical protein
MPSSYTTSGVVLISDSEESGTWGQVTNTNLQIINRFTSRAGSISLSGTTHTLDVSDGTLSDGHYGILVFGGSPSGTNMVTINPDDAQRIYMVKNDSGQSVIMHQGSGSTVTIPDNEGAIIYCDGAGPGASVVDMTATFGFQTYDADLAAIAGLTATDGNVIVGNGSTWVAESGDTVLTSLGVTATGAELNLLDGVTWTPTDFNSLTSTVAELNLNDGATAGVVTNSKTVVYGAAGEVAATTVDLGDWTVTESSGVLYFATSGVNKMKLDASGNLTVTGDITAFGSI